MLINGIMLNGIPIGVIKMARQRRHTRTSKYGRRFVAGKTHKCKKSDLKYYHGMLGYEAMVCKICGKHHV